MATRMVWSGNPDEQLNLYLRIKYYNTIGDDTSIEAIEPRLVTRPDLHDKESQTSGQPASISAFLSYPDADLPSSIEIVLLGSDELSSKWLNRNFLAFAPQLSVVFAWLLPHLLLLSSSLSHTPLIINQPHQVSTQPTR
ncbi:hypothetical protein TWF730_001592 [Orbilia blumenaviensis]|uniref:Uncharacterized protein n=1 Tax=Orbilia blumenaviensis TaxID=1796055 RepID=A0AAV9UIC8_9PEZI